MSRLHIALLILTALLSEFHYSAANFKDCHVHLSNGPVQGNCSHPLYDSYTRIPYARPPIGDLRFEAPEPATEWNGTLDATSVDPHICVGFSALFNSSFTQHTGQEDCLYVNVYVPRLKEPLRNPEGSLRVVIWLHPGGFQLGTARNSPEPVMQFGEAIVVTLGYRLGPLGFLSTQNSHIPGNNGLKDQRLAIRWVVENIAAFGGNINQILLMGNSAGSASVHAHLLTEGGRHINTFVGASGTLLNPWAFDRKPISAASEFGALLNCTTNVTHEEFKKCLKTKSVNELWDAHNKMYKFYVFRAEHFRPTIEPAETPNAFFTRDPIEIIRNGEYRNKRFLVGTVKGEGVYFAANLLQRNAKGKEVIEELNTRWEELCPLLFYLDDQSEEEQQKTCKELKGRYMCGKKFNFATYKLLERMFGDEYFHKGIDEMVRLHRQAGQRVYRYSADLPTRFNIGNLIAMNRMDLCFGSVHTADTYNILPPSHFETKINLNSTIERETIQNLIAMMISMLNTSTTPMYKDIPVPANLNETGTDLCIVLTYGKEKIGTCQQPPVDCKAKVESIKCIRTTQIQNITAVTDIITFILLLTVVAAIVLIYFYKP